MPDLQKLIEQIGATGAWIVILQLLLVVVVALLALHFAGRLVKAALDRLIDREASEGTAQQLSEEEIERRRRTLEDLGYNSARVLILAIAFLMALTVLRLDIGPAIAGLGVVGLALGLGAQNLVRDIFAGAFVLIENQYSVGDVVSVAGVSGIVEDINLRRTTLRSIDGTLHFVPHGLINVSSNLTRIWARVAFDVPVGYDVDVDAMTKVINQAGLDLAADPAWKERVLEPPMFLRLGEMGPYGMNVKVLGMISAADRWDALGEMRRRILDGARRAGITLGWPAEASGTMASQTDATLPSRRQR